MRILIIFVLLSFGKVFSQNSFFVTPSINTKLNICSTNWTYFSTVFPQNDYFDIYNNTLHFSPFIGLGLSVDWKNEKQNFLLGLSWNQDIASVSAKESYLSTNEEPSEYFSQELRTRKSLEIHRFSLNFSKPVMNESLIIKFGAGFIFSQSGYKKGGDHYVNSYSFDPFLLDTNITVGRTYSVTANNRLSLNLSIGLTADIKWNKSYLFSLDVIYTQGFKNITAGNFVYTIKDLNTGVVTNLDYGLYSKGSGFTLQISRRLNITNWFTRSKVKEI
ncbi:MAG: hypothetical protein ACQERC_01215 [Bacteroidota bacterium]